MLSAVMLLIALTLAPVIGGGFGELNYAILEILVFGAVIVHLLAPKVGQPSWLRTPGFATLSIFLVLAIVSTFFSESIYLSLRQLLLISSCFGGYILSASLAKNSKVATAMIMAVVFSALGICAVGIRHYAISAGGGAAFWAALMNSGEHMRLFGSFVNPGYFAGFIVVALPVTLAVYLVTKRSLLAFVMGLAFTVDTVALMLTGTKFGIVSAVFALLVFFTLAIATKSLRRSRFTRIIALSVILIPLLIVFLNPVKSRISAAETGGSQVHSTTFRIFTWKATLNMIQANPWVGVGPGVYSIAYPRYTIAGPTKAAHQSYLQLTSENGVPALVAFLVALMAIAHHSLSGIFRRRSEQTESAPKPVPKYASGSRSISWSDFVPFSGRRIMNCAIFAALTGSVVRNLVDSDWYIIGIALPFWILAGVLVSQVEALKTSRAPSRRAKAIIASLVALMALVTASFGVANYFAPGEIGSQQTFRSAFAGYEIASRVSPLNPLYHRELAKYLAADGDISAAEKQLALAARLAPTDGSVHSVSGMIALANDDPDSAIAYFNKALGCSPNSSDAVYKLSVAYNLAGDQKSREEAMSRLIEIENSTYEQLKGAPEYVDVNFAYAHAYFGRKYLAQERYPLAVDEFTQVTERLERWRSNKNALEVAVYAGMLTEEKKKSVLDLLRESYYYLAQAHEGNGQVNAARRDRQKGDSIE